MCDTSCSDVNLTLNRMSGEQEASDMEADDFPIVQTQRAGLYTVTITMVKCNGTCRFSVMGFSK